MAGPLKIIIVDDDLSNVDLLQQELEHLGYEMGSCTNGQEALDKIVNEASELVFPGILVSDIGIHG